MAGKIFVARVDGIADYNGQQIHIKAGVTRVREGHPLLKGRESIFREIEVQYDLEDARSAPQDEAKAQAEASAPAKDEAPLAPATAEDEEYLAPPKKPAPRTRGPRKASGA